eukprot:2133205-Prymnesium_polylepis.1
MACAQRNFVSVAEGTAAECPANGAAAGTQQITIAHDGWGGPSGLADGAPYTLVLLAHAHYLTLN